MLDVVGGHISLKTLSNFISLVERLRESIGFSVVCPVRSTNNEKHNGALRVCPFPRSKAACVFLRNGTGMSYRKVQDIMQVLFGMRFVPASAMAFDRKATQAAEPIYDVLLEKLRSAAVAFGDETFWRENGVPAYAWYGGNEEVAVYHIVPSRSGDVAAHLFGDHFPGVLHTDAYAGYNATNAKHRQTCLGHLIAKAKEISGQLELMSPALRDLQSMHFCQTIKAFFKLTCAIANRFRSGQIARCRAPVFMARLTSTLKTLCASPRYNCCSIYPYRSPNPLDYLRPCRFTPLDPQDGPALTGDGREVAIPISPGPSSSDVTRRHPAPPARQLGPPSPRTARASTNRGLNSYAIRHAP